jgi:hypothetical protein
MSERRQTDREREEATKLLLRSRFDWVPVPAAKYMQLAKRGEAKETWEVCARCVGKKRIGSGKAVRECDRCEGAGRIKIDPYTHGEKSRQALEFERTTGVEESVALKRRRIASELRKLELADKHRKGEIDPREKEAWEAAKDSLYRTGSFRELDIALTVLHLESPYDRAALEVVYGYDSPLRTVGPDLQKRADAAVSDVARLMPDPILVPTESTKSTAKGSGRWANGAAQQKRDREILRLHFEDGLNVAQISRRLGMPRMTVSDVLKPTRVRAA